MAYGHHGRRPGRPTNREHLQRSQEQVCSGAANGLQQAWRPAPPGLRGHAQPMWTAPGRWLRRQLGRPSGLQQRWQQRWTRQTGGLVPVGHWATTAGPGWPDACQPGPGKRRMELPADPLGGVSRRPLLGDLAGERADWQALLRLADELGLRVDLHVDESAAKAAALEQCVALVARLVREQRIAIPADLQSHSGQLVPAFQPSLLGPGRRDCAAAGLAWWPCLPPTSGCWAHHGGDTPNSRTDGAESANFSGPAVNLWQLVGRLTSRIPWVSRRVISIRSNCCGLSVQAAHLAHGNGQV